MKNKIIIIVIVLIILSSTLALLSWVVYGLNKTNLEQMRDLNKEMYTVLKSFYSERQSGPELRFASEKLLSYALDKDNSLFFIDTLEKNMQSISENSKIVSTRVLDNTKINQSTLIVNIKSEGNLKQILQIIELIENLRYLSYVEKMNIESLPKNFDFWQLTASLKVFIR